MWLAEWRGGWEMGWLVVGVGGRWGNGDWVRVGVG